MPGSNRGWATADLLQHPERVRDYASTAPRLLGAATAASASSRYLEAGRDSLTCWCADRILGGETNTAVTGKDGFGKHPRADRSRTVPDD